MQKSRARITYHLQEVEKMEPRKRNVLVAVVVGLLLFACCVTTAGLATKQYWWTAVCPPAEVIEKEVVVEKTVIVKVEVTPEPATLTEAPAEEAVQGCAGWAHGETKDLLPGQSALGDVEVNDVIKYDVGGTGEATVVINTSDKPISVYAEHGGAGCLVTTDLATLVNGELEHGCGSENGCDTVRIVEPGKPDRFFDELIQ